MRMSLPSVAAAPLAHIFLFRSAKSADFKAMTATALAAGVGVGAELQLLLLWLPT